MASASSAFTYIPIDSVEAFAWNERCNPTFRYIIDRMDNPLRRQELFVFRRWLIAANLSETTRITDAFCPKHTDTLADVYMAPCYMPFFTGLQDLLNQYKVSTIRKLMWGWRKMIEAVNWDHLILVDENCDRVNALTHPHAPTSIMVKRTVERACKVANDFYRTKELVMPEPTQFDIKCQFAVMSDKLNAPFKSCFDINVKHRRAVASSSSEDDDSTGPSQSDTESLAQSVSSVPESYDPILKVIAQWVSEKPGLAVKILELVASAV